MYQSRQSIGTLQSINLFIAILMDTTYKKSAGNNGEDITAAYYQDKWYTLLEKNYTIVWWELDLIITKNNILTFVEVKVINHMDDLHNYVTQKKLGHIKHTIAYYLLNHPTQQEYTLDVVFVKNNSIFEIYENITNT